MPEAHATFDDVIAVARQSYLGKPDDVRAAAVGISKRILEAVPDQTPDEVARTMLAVSVYMLPQLLNNHPEAQAVLQSIALVGGALVAENEGVDRG